MILRSLLKGNTRLSFPEGEAWAEGEKFLGGRFLVRLGPTGCDRFLLVRFLKQKWREKEYSVFSIQSRSRHRQRGENAALGLPAQPSLKVNFVPDAKNGFQPQKQKLKSMISHSAHAFLRLKGLESRLRRLITPMNGVLMRKES